jgi:hypothetical protein
MQLLKNKDIELNGKGIPMSRLPIVALKILYCVVY